jgi:hypothetical protein
MKGFVYNSALEELNQSIDLANAYIESYRSRLSRFAQDSESFENALLVPLQVSESDLGTNSYARVHLNPDTITIEVNLNSKFLSRLKFLHMRKSLRKYSDEWIILIFFFAIVLVHAYCHFVVRYTNWNRKTPYKLRKIHRGRMMNAGHTFEINVFGGILRLVQGSDGEFTRIILEEFESVLKFYKVEIEALKKIVNGKSPLDDLFDKDIPDEFIPEEKSHEHVLDSIVDLDEWEEPISDSLSFKEDTDEDFLRSINLDPKHNTILRFDEHECCVFHQ